MPAFTIGRLAKLYGFHRSSIYEAVAKGRVTAGRDLNDRRVIDLSEAIRVWGEPPTSPTAEPDTRQAEAVGAKPYPTDTLQPLIEELRLLREEVAQLRQAMLLLEYRPAATAPLKQEEPTIDAEMAEILGNLKARNQRSSE